MTEGEEDLQFLLKRNWRTVKMTPSPGKEPTPPKRSALLPATIRRQGKTPFSSSKPPWREAKREAAAAAGEATAAPRTMAAAAATTTMTMVETHRREARSAVGIQTPTTGRCRQYRRSRIKSRRIDSFVKSAFLIMNFPFNEIEFPQFRVFVYLPKSRWQRIRLP